MGISCTFEMFSHGSDRIKNENGFGSMIPETPSQYCYASCEWHINW
jgi:hypothetical protein